MQVYNSPYGTNSESHIPRSNSTSELFNLTADMKTASHYHHHHTLKKHHNTSISYKSNGIYADNTDFSISTNHAYKKKLTPYQLQRAKMQKSFMFPNGENFTPKTNHSKKRTQSLRSFTKHSNFSSGSINSTQTYNDSHHRCRQNVSNLSLQTKPNQIDIVRSTKAQSPVNSKKSSSDSDNSMKDENQSIITVPTTESDSQEITKPIYLPNSTASTSTPNLTSNVPVPPVKRVSMKRPKTASSESLPSKNDSNTNIEKNKKSSSGLKLGSIFKKLFGSSSSHKKRKLNNEKKVVTPPPKIEKTEPIFKMDDISLSLDPIITEDNSDDLMDTDLIFDSILLKVNNGKTSSPTKKFKKIETKAPLIQASSKDSIEEPYEDTNFIDHNLVNDFAKLGDFINLSITDDVNQPPPRSTKRPTLESKQTASEFYNAQPNIIKRLKNEFGVVLIDERPICNAYISGNQISILKSTAHSSTSKTVQFTNQVYLTNTYSVTDYERKDILFKKRMAMLMQGDRLFFDSVKKELNHYKRHEMPVHQDMRSYTQFFD